MNVGEVKSEINEFRQDLQSWVVKGGMLRNTIKDLRAKKIIQSWIDTGKRLDKKLEKLGGML